MYFKFAMNFIAQKTSRTVLSILLCVISVIIIVFTVILGTGTDYAYKKLDSMLSGGIKNVADLSVGGYNIEFAEELAVQPEINAVGDIQTYGKSTVLLKLAAECNVDLRELPYNNEIIYMNYHLLNLYDISLQSGEKITEITDFSKVYLYLGAGFKEIPIGTTYSTDSSDYIVAGILSEGQQILADTVVDRINHNQASYTVDGDYSVLGVRLGLSTDGLLLNAAEGYTLNDALDKAFAIAEKYDVDLKYTTLQEAFDSANEDTTIVKTIFSRLMPVIIISCVLMILVMQLSDIYGSLHEYGIMCSVGFTQNDVEKVTIIKNVITFAASFVISLPLTYFLIYFWYSIGTVNPNVIFHLLLTSALPTAIGIVLCTISISTVISIALIRKHTLVQMIGGHND